MFDGVLMTAWSLLTDWSSALIYITEGDTEEHLEILEGGVIKQLLEDKWKTFARVDHWLTDLLELLPYSYTC